MTTPTARRQAIGRQPLEQQPRRKNPRPFPVSGALLAAVVASLLAAASGCGTSEPAKTASYLTPAPPTTRLNACADRTGSVGKKGAGLVMPALADAVADYQPTAPNGSQAGLELHVHLVDAQVGTEKPEFTVDIPGVPELGPQPDGDADTQLAWSNDQATRTSQLNAAKAAGAKGAAALRAPAPKPTGSGVTLCLASFGETDTATTVLVSDAADNLAQPHGVRVRGRLVVLQLCSSTPQKCASDVAKVGHWWTHNGGGQVQTVPAELTGLNKQISVVLSGNQS